MDKATPPVTLNVFRLEQIWIALDYAFENRSVSAGCFNEEHHPLLSKILVGLLHYEYTCGSALTADLSS